MFAAEGGLFESNAGELITFHMTVDTCSPEAVAAGRNTCHAVTFLIITDAVTPVLIRIPSKADIQRLSLFQGFGSCLLECCFDLSGSGIKTVAI